MSHVTLIEDCHLGVGLGVLADADPEGESPVRSRLHVADSVLVRKHKDDGRVFLQAAYDIFPDFAGILPVCAEHGGGVDGFVDEFVTLLSDDGDTVRVKDFHGLEDLMQI